MNALLLNSRVPTDSVSLMCVAGSVSLTFSKNLRVPFALRDTRQGDYPRLSYTARFITGASSTSLKRPSIASFTLG